MEERINGEVVYYYDSHPTEEDLMGESNPHLDLVTYLVTLLRYLFRDQPCAVYGNLNFYQTRNPHEYPLVPDVAVIKGAAYDPFATSWKVGQDGPAPQVVFELLSEGTWQRDLTEKPEAYARMGVQEYFAYDPHSLPLSRDASEKFFGPGIERQLFGWRLDPGTRRMNLMPVGPAGQLWSEHLESTLMPEPHWLRLYDRFGHLRLTKAEAEARRAEVLAAKLRSLGFDPDQV